VRAPELLRSIASQYVSSAHTRVGRVLLIVLSGAALQVVMQAVLGRTLDKTDVGVISLLLGALPVLSTLSLVGQESSTVRFLSRTQERRYDTAAHVRRVLALVLPLAVLAAAAGAGFYGLGAGLAATLVVLVASQNAATVLTSVLRAAHRYELAMAGVRMPAMVAALALLALRAFDSLTLTTTAVALAATFGGSVLVFAVGTRRSLTTDGEAVPRSVMREGILFLGLGISFAFMIAVDKLIIGKMMTYADLAVYASVFAVMRGFDFLFYSISYVFMPRTNVMGKLRLGRLNASVAALAAVVAGGYLLLGDDVVRLLYAGRYDEGAFLIAPFVLSGVAKLFYSVPSSVIGGRLPRTALRQFMWFNLAGMGVNVVLDIVLIGALGLLGAAVATAAAWFIRLAGGYAIIWAHRGHLGAPAGEGTGPDF
jgi:O-antigen/teichoic acid export membrane protein